MKILNLMGILSVVVLSFGLVDAKPFTKTNQILPGWIHSAMPKTSESFGVSAGMTPRSIYYIRHVSNPLNSGEITTLDFINHFGPPQIPHRDNDHLKRLGYQNSCQPAGWFFSTLPDSHGRGIMILVLAAHHPLGKPFIRVEISHLWGGSKASGYEVGYAAVTRLLRAVSPP